jgi:hypothetical protein
LPSDPEYIRATPGEATPSFGKPVSSTTNARGSMKVSAHLANLARTSA